MFDRGRVTRIMEDYHPSLGSKASSVMTIKELGDQLNTLALQQGKLDILDLEA
jgi:hypothetical protein